MCVLSLSSLAVSHSYQPAMNNEKKLDSNPSVKFVFNGDTCGGCVAFFKEKKTLLSKLD